MNKYLFLGLFLGVAVVAGVALYLAAPKDDVLFDNYGLTPTSGVQENLRKMYEQGLIDRAGNPITNKIKSNQTGNYTLPKIDVPPSAQVNAAFVQQHDMSAEEERLEP